MKHQSAPIWTGAIAKWVKRPAPPLPLSLVVHTSSGEHRTVGTVEMQDAVHAFYSQLYNNGDVFTLPSRCDLHADIWPSYLTFDTFHDTLTQVIGASSAARAPGLHGTYYKLLPPEGVRAFSKFCYHILTTGVFPDTWFNIKVVLIPKKQGTLSLKDLRPLSIAPVPYRLFGKTLLRMASHAVSGIHSHSVGGVPGRSAQSAFLRVSMIIEHVRLQHGSFAGLAIDTQKFFDCIPFALALDCLLHVGLPPLIAHLWCSFIIHIRRYVAIKHTISTHPILCDRGVPQGDPISMFAAAAALACWLEELDRIPRHIHTEAWVFVDDRLLAERIFADQPWLSHAFHAACQWDSRWSFSTRPKTVAFGFGPSFSPPVWPSGELVQLDAAPVYLGVPLPIPGFSRSSFFEPILADCHCILDRVLSSQHCTTLAARRYAVSGIIQKKLTYASSVYRLTNKQYLSLRGKIFNLVYNKPLASYDAAVALVLQGHILDYKFAARYSSICAWERFFAAGGLSDFTRYWPPPSSPKGVGPLSLLQTDLQYLGWSLDADKAHATDGNGSVCWTLGSAPKSRFSMPSALPTERLFCNSLLALPLFGSVLKALILMPPLVFIAPGKAIPPVSCLSALFPMLTVLPFGFGKCTNVSLLRALTVMLRLVTFPTSYFAVLILNIYGMATAAFRVYKAYLTLRAIASSKAAWREENVPLIAQVMRHLFKGKSALYGADSHRKVKQNFKCEDREREVDLPLILNPSPLGRGNRELRYWGGKLSSISKETDRIKRVDHTTSTEGEDPGFPIKAFEEWMHLRPMAVGIPATCIAMSVASASKTYPDILVEIEKAMGSTRVMNKEVVFIKTSLEVTSLLADYHTHVDQTAPTPMEIFEKHRGQSSAGKAGAEIYERYTEIIKRISGTIATLREFFDFERIRKLSKISGAISQRPDDMLIPPTGSHGAVHYWLPAYGREIPSEYVLENIYERAYESSPDSDQAIMFHGTNLDDL